MTRRTKHRDGRRPALFGFQHGQPDPTAGQPVDNPLRRRCPTCHAQPAERCTRPARRGRRPIQGFHEARKTPPTEENR